MNVSIKNSLITNTASRSVADLSTRLISAFYWILIVRYLGAEGLGALVFNLALLNVFTTFSTMGLGALIIRDVSKDFSRASEYLGHSLLLGTLFAGVLGVLMYISSAFMSIEGETRSLTLIFALALPFVSGFYWCKSLLWAAEKLSRVALVNVIESVFKVTAGSILLILGYGLVQIALVILFSKIIAFLLNYYFVLRICKPRFTIHFATIGYFLKHIPVFSASNILYNIFQSATVLILTSLKGEAQAGIFSAAYKIVDLFLSFAHAYGQALFPIVSRHFQEGIELVKKLVSRSVIYIFVLFMGITAIFFALSEEILGFLYGSELMNISTVFNILIFSLLFLSLRPVLVYILVARHYEKYDLLANAVSTLFLLISSFIFINLWGTIGAAIAFLSSSVIAFMIDFITLYRYVFPLEIFRDVFKVVTAAVMMFCIIFLFRNMNVYIGTILSIAFYSFFIWITHTLDEINYLCKEIRLLE
ncbi:oligosaccharide flippase family protein [candidate division KSB1 bacterium]|nr:oligosaccharide flippase family protein [candidate division KSB1 bacterium]